MKYKNIFKEVKEIPFTRDEGGLKIQLLGKVEIFNRVKIYLSTVDIAQQLEESFNKNQLN